MKISLTKLIGLFPTKTEIKALFDVGNEGERMNRARNDIISINLSWKGTSRWNDL